MVMFLFVIAYIGPRTESPWAGGPNWQAVGAVLAAGLITREQCDTFLRDGAIGSHLENLQRHGGFKGFNQKAVSAIISATDPRKQAAVHTTTA